MKSWIVPGLVGLVIGVMLGPKLKTLPVLNKLP
jgi:hypothetical protein